MSKKKVRLRTIRQTCPVIDVQVWVPWNDTIRHSLTGSPATPGSIILEVVNREVALGVHKEAVLYTL